MNTREIITIQLGHYANFVGTHWWNLQEGNFSYDPAAKTEINHDVLYREGENQKGVVTYTPRLLIVDLKGSLGYLNEQGSLYNESNTDPPMFLWDNDNIEVTSEESISKPPFIQTLDEPTSKLPLDSIDFENQIDSWVDYLVPRFHPRTVNIIKEYEHKSSNRSFDIFNYGKDLWQTDTFSDSFSDKIRQYAEECDLMQGFQLLMDSTDGFAGLGASCVEHLRDEYGKSILAFPLISNDPNETSTAADLIKAVNIAMSWRELCEHTSLFSPLSCSEDGWSSSSNQRSMNNINYNLKLKYHTSALLATALDTLSLRYRHKLHCLSALSDLCADLNKMGRKAVATSLNLPFPMTIKSDLIDVLDEMEDPLWTSLTPNCKISGDESMQSLALRGVSEDRLKRPMVEAQKQMNKPAYRCSTVHEMMSMYLAYRCHASATYLTTVKAPLKVPMPFPKIFNNNVHENGDIAKWPVGEDVKSVPVLAGLHSGNYLKDMYDTLHTKVSRIKNIKKFPILQDSGLEQDDFIEMLDHLLTCKESYEDNYI
ncbi:hypothetical protein PV325_008038 [Microctonus aethiopoides]|nr:hypothetical protein PV325_008038 [Microctonus aethiopoides]